MTKALRFSAPITKTELLEDGRLMVEGVLTSESLDKSNEIIDYASVKKAVGSWAGNMREMHQAVAVGKATDIEFNDLDKQIIIKAFVSSGAPDTQAKILDGTLAAFSIGGKSAGKSTEKVMKGDVEVTATRIMMGRISEASFVDVGCNPDTGFTIVKFDDVENDAPLDDVIKMFADYGSSVWDASRAIEALSMIGCLLDRETEENEPEQVAVLKSAFESLKTFIASEIMETTESESETIEMSDTEADVVKTDDVSKLDDILKRLDAQDDIIKMQATEIEALKALPVPMKGAVMTISKSQDNNSSDVEKADIINDKAEAIAKIDDPVKRMQAIFDAAK